MDLGTMTVSLQADLSGLKSGLERAQDLVADSAARLARQEEHLRQAARGLEERWRSGWQTMDGASEAGLTSITRRFSRAVARMMADGEGLRDFWRRLWRDLLEIAVQRLLEMVLRARVAGGEMRAALNLADRASGGGLLGALFGGVGSVVGGIVGAIGSLFGFDNPQHDAWARKQGFDFARHFRAGVAEALAAPLVNLPQTLSPVLAGAGIGSMRAANFRAVSVQSGAFQVNIYAQRLDERAVRDAGAIIADEVTRRLGWVDKRSGL
jgi:hypothetical protein